MKIKQEARNCLLSGVDLVANAVGATLGPKGRTAIIHRGYGPPEVTKDGVTVAREVFSEDPYERIGVELIREAAIKTNEIAGDGTSTATVLTQALCHAGIAAVENGAEPIHVRKGIEKAVEEVLKYVRSAGVPIAGDLDKIQSVATISANNDYQIGKLIRDAVELVGIDGIIMMGEARNEDSFVDKIEGMEFTAGYASPYFITNPARQEVEYEDPFILITDKKIENVQILAGVIEHCASLEKPLILVAEDFEATALATLIRNRINGHFKIAAMKMPGFGDFKREGLDDLAIFTGGTVISSTLGTNFDSMTPHDLGTCRKVVMTKSRTIFTDGAGEKELMAEHYENIKKQVPVENTYNKGKFLDRLKRISGKVATVHVGAITESELVEKKYRVEDAINAVNSAIEEGVIPGGGTVLVKATLALDKLGQHHIADVQKGVDAVKAALYSPFNKILRNAAVNPDDHVGDILLGPVGIGFNADTLEFGDFWDSGVLDTVKSTCIAIETAGSIASNIIMTEVLINAERKRDSPEVLPFRP